MDLYYVFVALTLRQTEGTTTHSVRIIEMACNHFSEFSDFGSVS